MQRTMPSAGKRAGGHEAEVKGRARQTWRNWDGIFDCSHRHNFIDSL